MAKKSSIGRPEEIYTILGTETSLSGTLRFDSSLMIRGKFKGDIEAKGALYIDENAVVDAGTVRALSIVVAGNVSGRLEAADKLELKPGAQLRGNIRAAKLRIADGVIFEGRCEMIRHAESYDPFREKAETDS